MDYSFWFFKPMDLTKRRSCELATIACSGISRMTHADVYSEYILLGELLSLPELSEAMRLAGIDDGSGVNFEKDSGKVTMNPSITSFIEEMVANCQLSDGVKVFDYWADTGVGSWIRLAGQRESQGQYRYRRYSNGNGSTQNGSQSCAHATRPPARQVEPPCPPRSAAQFQGRALPGWVTRVQSADGVATPATRTIPAAAASTLREEAPATSLPPSSASTFLKQSGETEEVQPDRPPPPSPDLNHVVSQAIPKRNKVSNKMKHETTGAPEIQVAPVPPTPKPPPAELRQVAPAPAPSIPVPAPLPQEPARPAQPPAPEVAPEQAKEPWELPEQVTSKAWIRGMLRSYHPDQACGYLALPGRAEQILLRASAIEGEIPPEFGEGYQIEVEVEDLEKEPRVLRAKVAAAPQLPRKESHAPGEATSTKRGRIKTFMLDRGFGFCQLEEADRTVDVFIHISSFEGPVPEDFHGMPGSPPVGQEVEIKLGDTSARPRACWARVVGPALPMDKANALSSCLSHVLKSAERLEGKPKKGGWHKLVDILATDSLRVAVTAYSPTGVAEIKMGNIPEPLMNCLHDLAVCVVAPTPEAAAEAIAGSVPSTAEASESSSRFHLWLEQEAFIGENSPPEAERLWIRTAYRGGARGFLGAKAPPEKAKQVKEKSWWEGGGTTARTGLWEPQHLKALCSNPLGDCTADDVLKVLGALPVDAPSEVRRYLEAWEKRMRLK
ncbi:AVT1 [Symbiodinium sp. CCMP2592]|nr:AVT1 [Symbiodinium sp. CCMP2592]